MNGDNSSGTARILVVDDEPSIVDAVATALRYEGYEVREEGTDRGAMAAVGTYVSDLRKKLDALGPPLIRTVRQAGHMLEAED